MASVREWQFKRKFRTNAYGWRASSLAIGRLKEAAAEIRSVAKSDPVAAGDGVVSLMERIWPAFQGIDTSSGALGAAVLRTVNELIPILTVASADHATRGKWLERLFEAVQSDGVEYLAPLEDRWGEIAQYPDLIDEYADRMIGMVRRAVVQIAAGTGKRPVLYLSRLQAWRHGIPHCRRKSTLDTRTSQSESSLADAMHQFDTGDRNRRGREALEAPAPWRFAVSRPDGPARSDCSSTSTTAASSRRAASHRLSAHAPRGETRHSHPE